MRSNSFPFQQTQETMKRLAQLVKQDLLRQVPQPGQNPYATGQLERSLEVTEFNQGDEWTLAVTYDAVGNYTNLGTRNYAPRWRQESQMSLFELPNFRGYRKGKGGIRPQYWLSLSRQENKYIKELEGAIELDYETFINRVIDNLSRPL